MRNSTVLVGVLIMACNQTAKDPSLPKAEAPTLSAAHSAAPVLARPEARAPDHRLGGGYRDLSWGINEKEVLKRVKLKPKKIDDSSMDFELEGGKELYCSFHEHKLWGVILKPNIYGDKRERLGLLAALTEKFGTPRPVEGMKDGFFGWPQEVYGWIDDDTEILMRTTIPPETVSVSQSTDVLYRSTVLLAVVRKASEEAEQKKNYEQFEKARKGTKDHL